MHVCVALEQRFVRLPDRTIWTQSGFASAFWERYLAVFDRVWCVARVQDVDRLTGEWHRSDAASIAFEAVPHYMGPLQFARRIAEVRRAVRGAVHPGRAWVLRLPGAVGELAWRELAACGYPFGVEVVGDPYDVFAPGAVRHPLRPLLRWHATRRLKRQCREACGVSYVTEAALQHRYPASGPTIAASNVELREDAFVERPRTPGGGPLKLLFVGSLEQYYKAPDVVIDAVARALASGLDLQLTIVGDGRIRPALEDRARRFGCADRIRFAGHLSGPGQVRREIDAADLFVLPSRTEGLPRAMIEAMARGLPCIGSRVGGIPELLPPQATVPPGDVTALFDRIREITRDVPRMHRMAAVNLRRARAFRHDILQARRVRFYRHIREATEAWSTQAAPPAVIGRRLQAAPR
jgi:glycosyltransferase involved in cell wall biosynthesis